MKRILTLTIASLMSALAFMVPAHAADSTTTAPPNVTMSSGSNPPVCNVTTQKLYWDGSSWSCQPVGTANHANTANHSNTANTATNAGYANSAGSANTANSAGSANSVSGYAKGSVVSGGSSRYASCPAGTTYIQLTNPASGIGGAYSAIAYICVKN